MIEFYKKHDDEFKAFAIIACVIILVAGLFYSIHQSNLRDRAAEIESHQYNEVNKLVDIYPELNSYVKEYMKSDSFISNTEYNRLIDDDVRSIEKQRLQNKIK